MTNQLSSRDSLRVAVVYGSAREGRFCDIVTEWVFSHLWSREDIEISLIDPALLWQGRDEALARERASLARTIAAADAFIVVTPEYNHSFSAPLKHLIDSFKTEWRAKPVAFVSYGGISGGLRAVEQLRLVFAELGTMTIRETVSFAKAHALFDVDGMLREPEAPTAALHVLIEELVWWGRALADARGKKQIAEAAA